MEFEDILHEVGSFGRFQKALMALFIIPVAFLIAWFWMGLIFMTSTPDHWCHVPELWSSNLTIDQQRSISSPPSDPSCSMYNISYGALLSSGNFSVPPDTQIVSCTNGWVYDKTNWDATLTTKWNLVCEDGHYTSMIFTLQNAGGLVGTSLYGAISDRFGRKKAFLILGVIVTVTEVCSILVNDFRVFAALRFINGSVFPILFTLSYILIVELVSPSKRTSVNGVMNFCWSVGICSMPLIAYLARSWIVLACINLSISALLLLAWKFIPESPSWLIGRGRYEEARDVMVDIATKNNLPSEATTVLTRIKTLGDMKRKKKEDEKQIGRFVMFKYSRLRRHFFILTFCWAANATASRGLTYNTRNLVGSEFMNYFLIGLLDGPGCLTFWMVMAKLGRRWTATFGFLLIGVVCLVPLTGLPHAELVTTMLGKYLVVGNFIVTDQQGSELYPTVSRSFGMGLSFTIAKSATSMVPYLAYLSVYWKLIPFMVIAATCFIAAVLASFLPETVNENLPQTVPDADELGKDKKYFSWERYKPVTKVVPNKDDSSISHN